MKNLLTRLNLIRDTRALCKAVGNIPDKKLIKIYDYCFENAKGKGKKIIDINPTLKNYIKIESTYRKLY